MLLVWGALLVLAGQSAAKIPSYIKVCKRNNPNMDQCILDSINALRPKLLKGIPELDIPPLDPVRFKEMVISQGGAFKAVGSNILVRGAANTKFKKLKSDIDNLTFDIELEIPYMNVEADYDVKMKILSINIEGKGFLQSNNTDVTTKGVLKGRKFTKDGKTYIKFVDLKLQVYWKDYSIRLDNLYNGDKKLGDAVNKAINQNKNEMMELIRPTVENLVSTSLLELANKVCDHFTYEELFPDN